MDDRVSVAAELSYLESADFFSGIDVEGNARLFEAMADVILIVDSNDCIHDARFKNEDLHKSGGSSWIGRPWMETVTSECDDKVLALLDEARSGQSVRPREINHAMPHGDDVPVKYTTALLNDQGFVVAFGQDISRIASLQRKLMNAQLAMEREFSRLRAAESLYRAMYQLSDVAKIVVDATTLRITEMNVVARRLFGRDDNQRVENTKMLSLFEGSKTDLLHKMLLTLVDDRSSGSINVLLPDGTDLAINASQFRQGRRSYLLLQAHPNKKGNEVVRTFPDSRLTSLVQSMPDASVVTSASREIIWVNNAFLELFDISNVNDVVGQSFDSWFDRPNVDCSVLLTNIREHGTVGRFATVMRGAFGQRENVEIAATQIDHDGHNVLGFWIRPTSPAVMGSDDNQDTILRSNEQIANLVGHMPLKDIVRETTQMIERLCIETALELTRNNRASAAQMLGLSRQSLYAKLGREQDEN